jgi:hypothetical protein
MPEKPTISSDSYQTPNTLLAILSHVEDLLTKRPLYPFSLQIEEILPLSSENGEVFGTIPVSFKIDYGRTLPILIENTSGMEESSIPKSFDTHTESKQG